MGTEGIVQNMLIFHDFYGFQVMKGCGRERGLVGSSCGSERHKLLMEKMF